MPAAVSATASATTSRAATEAPSAASRRAVPRPMPDPAPVTTATLPSKRRTRNPLEDGVGGVVLLAPLTEGDALAADRAHEVPLSVGRCGRRCRANRSRSVCFRILPAGLRGTSSTSSSCSGTAFTRSPCSRRYAAMVGEVELLAPGHRHDRAGPLTRLRVGEADHGHVGHGRMPVEQVLHLLGRDVLPVPDDHVLESSGDGHEPVLVHDAEVPAAEVPLLVEGLGVERRVEVARG